MKIRRLGLLVACAVLLLCGSAAAQTRFAMGPNPFTDTNGHVWSPIPPADISGGSRQSTCAPTWTNGGLYKQQLVFTGTTGTLTVAVPQGPYTVNLYFGDPCVGQAVGTRLFSVVVNGIVVDPALDIVKEAGGAQKPLIKTATVTSSSVVVTMTLSPTIPVGNGVIVIAGLEILPAGPVITSVAFNQTVNGSGFVNGTVVSEGGVPCPTQFVSSTQLTSQCPAGTGTMTVSNPVVTPHSVKLTWTAATVPTGAPPVTAYNVLKGNSTTGPFSLLASTAALSYSDTNVTDGQTPCYVFQAVNSVGPSANSVAACATVP